MLKQKNISLKVYLIYRNLFKYNKTCTDPVYLRAKYKVSKYKLVLKKTYDIESTDDTYDTEFIYHYEYTYDYKYSYERKNRDPGLDTLVAYFLSISLLDYFLGNEKTISENLLRDNDDDLNQ
jgi:hypothetical protein